MRTLFLSLLCLFGALTVLQAQAQDPGIAYQAVARDADGDRHEQQREEGQQPAAGLPIAQDGQRQEGEHLPKHKQTTVQWQCGLSKDVSSRCSYKPWPHLLPPSTDSILD